MYPNSSPLKRDTYTLPTVKPETGLAEWTSKIKAMQRQVDADEEAEQKRLEEEIAASRLARLRRTQGVGYGGRSNSVGMSKLSNHPPTSVEGSESETSNNKKIAVNWQNIQESVPVGIPVEAVASSVSLASFMGGNASGPKLNRPVPQQDIHDLSQFQRLGHRQTTHPVFGKGGVAMHGMTQHIHKAADSKQSRIGPPKQNWSEPLESSLATNTILSGATSTQSRAHVAPKHTMSIASSRQSTSVEESSTHYHDKQFIADASNTNRDNDTPNKPSGLFGYPPKAVTPHEKPRRFSDVNAQKSSVAVKSLARPISPRARVSPSLPQTPPSQLPSPAFIRHPLQKDPTPSISRLQGRGFVQSMVKVSTQLESPPAPIERTPEKGLLPGGRRVSILDRWQENPQPLLSPPPSTTKPIHRLATADPRPGIPQQKPSLSQDNSSKPLKSIASSSSLRPTRADMTIPIQSYNKQDGLGSATTLLVYKPKLTDPAPQTTDVDELGFHQKVTGALTGKGGRELPASSGSPLSHLTKNRARKPRRIRHLDPKLSGVTPDLTHTPELRSNVHSVSSSASSRSLASTPSQQSKYVGSAAVNIVPHLPNISPPSLPQDENPIFDIYKHTGVSDTAENQAGVPPKADDVLCSTDTHLPIVTLDGENGGGKSISHSSSKYPRIPSTGKRATVMDIAQTLQDQSSEKLRNDSDNGLTLDSPPTLRTGGETRKSNYDKISSITLPPLEEEVTPLSSPIRTLTHTPTSTQRQTSADLSFKPPLSSLRFDEHLSDHAALRTTGVEIILNSYQPKTIVKPATQDISTEVMIITGITTTSLAEEQWIFYDTELLAIVHRFKSSESGLVSTVMWVWKGKCCVWGEREESKSQELARRYGIAARIVPQDSEQPDLVHVLGGRLAIRQGTRTHWTPENTAMHLIRSKGGVIFIDEHDLNIMNLCSAFSYCISVLDTLYVWHGRGSTMQERKAALEYALSLKRDGSHFFELSEDGVDDDEMFWLILGNREFAKADYWRWRKTSLIIDPRVWRVDTTIDNMPILPIISFFEEQKIHSSIYIVDCVWELFILVGRDARNQKRNITLALEITSELSTRIALERPYTPTIHVLFYPTQLPCDLRLNLRGLNERFSENNLDVPDHMNILTSAVASTYVYSDVWDQIISQGQPMLPSALLS